MVTMMMMNIPSLGELFISKSNHERHRKGLDYSLLCFFFFVFCFEMQNILSSSAMWICAHTNMEQERTAASHRRGFVFNAGFMTNICPTLRGYESLLLRDIVI